MGDRHPKDQGADDGHAGRQAGRHLHTIGHLAGRSHARHEPRWLMRRENVGKATLLMDEPVQKSLERYDVLDRIAVGGMAEVFLAKAYGAHGFEKTIAIKKIL